MAKLDMLDISVDEFNRFYKNNSFFISNITNYFYLKNDKEKSSQADRVLCGHAKGVVFDKYIPDLMHFGALLLANNANVEAVQRELRKIDNPLFRFKKFELSNKVPAYLGVVTMNDGSNRVAILIPNEYYKMSLPFSNGESFNYANASKEEETLPYMVENDIIYNMIPEDIKKLMGVEASLQSIDELKKEIQRLKDEIKLLNEENTTLSKKLVNESKDKNYYKRIVENVFNTVKPGLENTK